MEEDVRKYKEELVLANINLQHSNQRAEERGQQAKRAEDKLAEAKEKMEKLQKENKVGNEYP